MAVEPEAKISARHDVTGPLAHWIAGEIAIPENVAEWTRMLILDGVGCGIFGLSLEWCQPVREFASMAGGSAPIAIWGTADTAGLLESVLVHGTAIHAYEYDDLHRGAVVHGESEILPVALGISAARAGLRDGAANPMALPTADVRDKELLSAVAVGYEVAARVGLATGAPQLARGFHPSPNSGVFGAAATASRLLHLDAPATRDALGIAGSFAGHLMAAQYGSTVKRVHSGRSSQSGLVAALLARSGVSGIRNVFEAEYGGFGSSYAGLRPDGVASIADGLGSTWQMEGYGLKQYPCCGSNHTAVEAVRALRADGRRVSPADVAEVRVRCSTLTLDHVGWPYVPQGVTAAQMNLRFCVASTLVHGRLTVEEFEPSALENPDVLALVKRITVEADPAIDALGSSRRHTVNVQVRTTGGDLLERTVDEAGLIRSTDKNDSEIVRKFNQMAGRVMSSDHVERIARTIEELGRNRGRSSVNRLMELLACEGNANRG